MPLDLDKFSVTDVVQSVTTIAGIIFAVVYVRQNNATLREMRRQNDLLSDPVLRFEFLADVADLDAKSLKECHAERAEASFVRLKQKWDEHLNKIGVDYPDAASKCLYLKLQNKGVTTVEKVKIITRVYVQHHEVARKDFRDTPETVDLSVELTVDLDAGAPPTFIRLLAIDSFPVIDISASKVVYVDVRKKEHLLADIDQVSRKQLSNPAILPKTLTTGPQQSIDQALESVAKQFGIEDR